MKKIINIYLNACLRGVSGDPSEICPKLGVFVPFIRHVSRRFLGGSTVSSSLRDFCEISSSSSRAGRRLFRSSSKK